MTEFSAYYLGHCFVSLKSKKSELGEIRSNEERVIDQIENEQIEGSIPRDSEEKIENLLRISKQGVHIFDSKNNHVVSRIPLLHLVFTVSYYDGHKNYNSVIVEKVRDKDDMCCCHVLQVSSSQNAERICGMIKSLFEDVQSEHRRFDDENDS